MSALVPASELHAELERQVAAAGTIAEWARRHGLARTPVSLVMRGHRPMPESIANALGFVAETAYRRVASHG